MNAQTNRGHLVQHLKHFGTPIGPSGLLEPATSCEQHAVQQRRNSEHSSDNRTRPRKRPGKEYHHQKVQHYSRG